MNRRPKLVSKGQAAQKKEGESMELNVLPPPDGGSSALSVNLLEEHNKSMQTLGEEVKEKEKVSSWLQQQGGRVKISKPVADRSQPTLQTEQGVLDPQHITANVLSKPSLPTVMVMAPGEPSVPRIVIAGDDIMQAGGVEARIARVHSMMSVDSAGLILPPVMMSNSGRYQALSTAKAAFEHIHLQDLVNIEEQESMLRESKASVTSGKLLMIANQLRRASAITKSRHRADTMEGQRDDLEIETVTDADVKVTEDEVESSRRDSEMTETTLPESQAPTVESLATTVGEGGGLWGKMMSKATQPIKKAAGGLGTILLASKWKTKMKRGADKTNNLFTQQLEWHTNRVIEELPMPLKIEVYKEAYPITAETVRAYEKSLGKGHYMTMESKEELEKLTANYEELMKLA